jgi:hypothetical protein
LISARKKLDKAQVDTLLSELGVSPTVRAETLAVEELLRLGEAVRALE